MGLIFKVKDDFVTLIAACWAHAWLWFWAFHYIFKAKCSKCLCFDCVEDYSTGASSCLAFDRTSRPPVVEHRRRIRSDRQRVLIRDPLRSQLQEDIMFLTALTAACDVHYCFLKGLTTFMLHLLLTPCDQRCSLCVIRRDSCVQRLRDLFVIKDDFWSSGA